MPTRWLSGAGCGLNEKGDGRFLKGTIRLCCHEEVTHMVLEMLKGFDNLIHDFEE